MKHIKKTLALFLALALAASLLAIPSTAVSVSGTPSADGWDGETCSVPVISGREITITTAEELAWVSAHSRGADADNADIPAAFSGYTLNVTADIDLNHQAWTPIDNFHGTFKGVLADAGEGGYVTISNFTVSADGDYAGLFGNINFGESAGTPVFQNICLTNVELTGERYLGALVGQGYTARITNCHAKDVTVTGNQYAGGLVGSGYCTMTDCTVDGAVITATKKTTTVDGDNVGGMIGFLGEGNITLSGCTVSNSSVTATRQAGGVAGVILYGNSVVDCRAVNTQVHTTNTTSQFLAKITKSGPAAGGIVGEATCGGNTAITISGCTVDSDCAITSAAGTYPVGGILGYAKNYSTAALTMSGNAYPNGYVEARTAY